MSLVRKLEKAVQSKQGRFWMAKLYGIGASVVIIGALAKLQHWSWAGWALMCGLGTEAIIFFFYAFESETEWGRVWPELDLTSEDFKKKHSSHKEFRGDHHDGGGSGMETLVKFDKMLEKAEITPDLLQNLGAGMKKLSETTANMNAMGDVTAASSKYMNTINNANELLGELSDSYHTTTKIINETGYNYKNISDSLSVIEVGGKSYQQQLESLNKNLSALNAVYELHRNGANDHLKESDSLFTGIQGLMKDLSESAGDTKKYREQITKLNDNLSALNNVYGNMLAAMNFK
ncbi:MAG: gliding motility protein GldL [Bacteroidales bacterium]|nr:gliding motility protein GldL [Bacteroidales bacterium]